MEVHTILVPIDFSDHASKALDTAIDLARQLDARLHLLHAYPIHSNVYPYGFIIGEELERKLGEAAQQHLDDWCQRAVDAGVAAEARVAPGTASEAILDLARELPADLIVMGTRGLAGLKHVMLGSVAERTVRLAPCPVLTVKA